MKQDIFTYALAQSGHDPGRALWLHGEEGFRGDVWHPQKPGALADPVALDGGYDTVLLSAPKNRQETEGLLALALSKSSGLVIAAAPNDAGGGRLAAMLENFGVSFDEASKSKHRIVWTGEPKKADAPRLAESLKHLVPREVEMDGDLFWTVPGLFGWDRADPGSRLLVQHLPNDLSGLAADFGCGYGYLAAHIARHLPGVARIDAFDSDIRAVSSCARNGGQKTRAFQQDVRAYQPKPLYDIIVANPPFHDGKREDTGLGRMFLQKAWESLKPGGRLFAVANRHLPYEKTVPGLGIAFEGGGYKIFTGRKQ